MRSFGVMLVPSAEPPPGLPADAPALVIDVLRATTTLTYALRNGCARDSSFPRKPRVSSTRSRIS